MDSATATRAWQQRTTQAEREEIEGIDHLIELVRKRRQTLMARIKTRTAAWSARHNLAT
jgi:hypothetical protein